MKDTLLLTRWSRPVIAFFRKKSLYRALRYVLSCQIIACVYWLSLHPLHRECVPHALHPYPQKTASLEGVRTGALYASKPTEYRLIVPMRGTLYSALAHAGCQKSQLAHIVKQTSRYQALKRVKAGQVVTVMMTEALEGKDIHSVLIPLDSGDTYRIVRNMRKRYVISFTPATLIPAFLRVQGVIRGVFLQDMVRQGLSLSQAQKVVRSLASAGFHWRVHLKTGDAFSLLCRQFYCVQNKKNVFDNVLVIKITHASGDKKTLYRYHCQQDKRASFYHANAVSCQRESFVFPVRRGRITSYFGWRTHPISGHRRPHRGIDYSAPTGTPVAAAADGVVEKIGWYGHYGRYVRIRHKEGFSTAYAHLHRYAKSLHRGQKVGQGEVIGSVGATGKTTGPHLHFELLKYHAHINPLLVRSLAPKILHGIHKISFESYVKQVRDIYHRTPPYTVAARMTSHKTKKRVKA